MNRRFFATAQICAVVYGMTLAALQLELFASAETSQMLLFWALMPMLWLIKLIAPDLLGSISVYAVAGANVLLVFFTCWGALAAARKMKKEEPNQSSQPTPSGRG